MSMNTCSLSGSVPRFPTEQNTQSVQSSPLPPEKLSMDESESFQEDFFGYVEKTKSVSKVDFDEAQKLVQEGKHFLRQLRSGGFRSCSREEGRGLIVPLIWHLMARAFKKKSGFSEGMIVLEDPRHRVANFFSQFGSKRMSSHYPDRVIGSSFGIDQPSKLPAGFRTVLFGKLLVPPGEKEWTFFKPETYGTESLGELALHSLSYCAYQFRNCLGTSAGPFDRTEAIIPPLAEKVHRLVKASIVDKAVVKQWGLSGVFRTLMQNQKARSPSDEQLVRQFFSDVAARYDWLNIRCGNEVVLSCDKREERGRAHPRRLVEEWTIEEEKLRASI